jgi:hypothetical protein
MDLKPQEAPTFQQRRLLAPLHLQQRLHRLSQSTVAWLLLPPQVLTLRRNVLLPIRPRPLEQSRRLLRPSLHGVRTFLEAAEVVEVLTPLLMLPKMLAQTIKEVRKMRDQTLLMLAPLILSKANVEDEEEAEEENAVAAISAMTQVALFLEPKTQSRLEEATLEQAEAQQLAA